MVFMVNVRYVETLISNNRRNHARARARRKLRYVNRLRVRSAIWAVSIIIIIINFYGAYILRNLSSEAQQKIIIKHNREQGRAKVIIRTRDNQRCMAEMQFGIKFNMS